MPAKTEFSTPSDSEIRFVRRFAGGRVLLWAMWTQAEHLQQWWGPVGWSMPFCELDFRPGGHWFYCMQGPDMRSFSKMTYQQIDAPRRFTGVEVFVDAQGNPVADMPVGESVFAFEDADGETIVSATTCYGTKATRNQVIDMDVEASVRQMFERLDAYLASLA